MTVKEPSSAATATVAVANEFTTPTATNTTTTVTTATILKSMSLRMGASTNANTISSPNCRLKLLRLPPPVFTTDDARERDRLVETYLESFVASTSPEQIPRVHCCGKKGRCLYCPGCGRTSLLESEKQRPPPLPFDLDVVVDDRPEVATGLHACILLGPNDNDDDDNNNRDDDGTYDENENKNETKRNDCSPNRMSTRKRRRKVRRINGVNNLPSYSDDDEHDGTFLLFPCKGQSVPLSSLPRHALKRLVVLDCKWTKASGLLRNYPSLASLPKVHLSHPPATSHFWRWHNAGPGCISTIEAIFCAAWERWGMDYDRNNDNNIDDPLHQRTDHLRLLYLFGMQRVVIREAALREQRILPYTEDGKEKQRALRRNNAHRGSHNPSQPSSRLSLA